MSTKFMWLQWYGYVFPSALSWRYFCLECQFEQKKCDIKLARYAVMMTRVLFMTACTVHHTNKPRAICAPNGPTVHRYRILSTWQRRRRSSSISLSNSVLRGKPGNRPVQDNLLLFLQASVVEVRKVDSLLYVSLLLL